MSATMRPVRTEADREELAELAAQIWGEYWPALIGEAQTRVSGLLTALYYFSQNGQHFLHNFWLKSKRSIEKPQLAGRRRTCCRRWGRCRGRRSRSPQAWMAQSPSPVAWASR